MGRPAETSVAARRSAFFLGAEWCLSAFGVRRSPPLWPVAFLSGQRAESERKRGRPPHSKAGQKRPNTSRTRSGTKQAQTRAETTPQAHGSGHLFQRTDGHVAQPWQTRRVGQRRRGDLVGGAAGDVQVLQGAASAVRRPMLPLLSRSDSASSAAATAAGTERDSWPA